MRYQLDPFLVFQLRSNYTSRTLWVCCSIYSVHRILVNRFDGQKNEKNHYNIKRVKAKNVADITHNGGVREIHCLCYIDFENRRYRPVERQQGALKTDDDSSRLLPPPQTGAANIWQSRARDIGCDKNISIILEINKKILYKFSKTWFNAGLNNVKIYIFIFT